MPLLIVCFCHYSIGTIILITSIQTSHQYPRLTYTKALKANLRFLFCTDVERLAVDPTVPSEGASSNPIVLNGLGCEGTERTLSECNQTSSFTHCSHSRDVGVRCRKSYYICIDGVRIH